MFLVLAGIASAAEIAIEVGSVAAPAWRADGVTLAYSSPEDLQLSIAAVAVSGRPSIRDLRLRCTKLEAGKGARCDDASFSADVTGFGKLEGRLRARFINQWHWHAELDAPAQKLRVAIDQAGDALTVAIVTNGLNYSEPSGKYTAEKLSGKLTLAWDAARERLNLDLDAHAGQAYAEPLFFDFGALPLKANGAITPVVGRAMRAGTWRIEQLHATQGTAGTLELTGALDKAFKPTTLDATFTADNLGPLVTTDVLPFLIGGKLDGASASGKASGKLSMRDGRAHSLAVQFKDASLDAKKLGLALDGVSGDLNWLATGAPGSRLQWRGGAMSGVPLGASDIAFVAQGSNFTLTSPWRQPLLGGALKVDKLALRDAGTPQVTADFQGALDPIDLAALCKALGWPVFTGTLGGRLPGLSVRDDEWTIDGALEAQVFDGNVRIDKLRAMQPFGALPRVMADVQVRKLDLERLTGAFSLGRITGRLDGDVTGLRLLSWSPVAFDGRLYSTPGFGGERRISQRAIDTISSIGGGPTGLISRGFFKLFQDFAYDKLGISCVLRDGVCEMDGIEPVKSKDGQPGYYLVKGRLLPRIDVVGYARRVSWSNLIEQLKAARASGGPELKKPEPPKESVK